MDEQIKSAQLNIRELVSQVKSGDIDKNTAYENLQTILRANAGGASNGPETDDGVIDGQGDGDDDQMSQNTGKISQEDRRILINKLIEKKRQNRSDAADIDKDGGMDGDAFGAQAYNDGNDAQNDGACITKRRHHGVKRHLLILPEVAHKIVPMADTMRDRIELLRQKLPFGMKCSRIALSARR